MKKTAKPGRPASVPLCEAEALRSQLRNLRKRRGLTQADVAKRMGVHQVRVSDIEAKPGVVSIEQLMKLFEALGCELVVRPKPAAAATQSSPMG